MKFCFILVVYLSVFIMTQVVAHLTFLLTLVLLIHKISGRVLSAANLQFSSAFQEEQSHQNLKSPSHEESVCNWFSVYISTLFSLVK